MPKELTPEHHAAFDAKMARLGLDPAALTHQAAVTSELRQGHPAAAALGPSGPVVFSSDPEESHVPPTLVQVANIAQFNQMVGVPDEHYTSGMYSDKAIQYPAPLPQETASLFTSAANKCDLEYNLTDDHMDTVRLAAQAYVQGDSSKVQHYEPMINALMFPSQVAVFTGEDLVIDTEVVITGPDPVVWNYKSVSIKEPNGQIVAQTEFTINAQTFTVTPAS